MRGGGYGGGSTPAHSTRQPQRGFFPQEAGGNDCLDKFLGDFFFRMFFFLSVCVFFSFI